MLRLVLLVAREARPLYMGVWYCFCNMWQSCSTETHSTAMHSTPQFSIGQHRTALRSTPRPQAERHTHDRNRSVCGRRHTHFSQHVTVGATWLGNQMWLPRHTRPEYFGTCACRWAGVYPAFIHLVNNALVIQVCCRIIAMPLWINFEACSRRLYGPHTSQRNPQRSMLEHGLNIAMRDYRLMASLLRVVVEAIHRPLYSFLSVSLSLSPSF